MEQTQEQNWSRIDLKSYKENDVVINGAMYEGTVSREAVNRQTGKSFTSTDYVFRGKDGTKIFMRDYSGLKNAMNEQQVKEGDIVSVTYNGIENFTTKGGRSASKFLIDVNVE